MKKEIVDSVGLAIRTADGRHKEIPLEVWQAEVLCQILGLNIHLPDLDDYELSGKAVVMERMELYYDAVRQLHHQQRD